MIGGAAAGPDAFGPGDRAEAGIYVHVPFCLTRCGYCDFNAYSGLDHLGSRYIDALRREADLASSAWDGQVVSTVFLGGGTPTTRPPEELAGLLAHLASVFETAGDVEVTVEANPDTVDTGSLHALLDAGFARVSMGAQSFDPSVLRALERLHTPEAALRAFDAAREAGYDNVNLDLIYGADGETAGSWAATLERTIALGPEHISAYALTIEPATPLGRKVAAGEVPAPDPDLQAEMFELACGMLASAGYGHYEVSNWARPGYECRHNLGYWERRPYLGLGAGAHSYRDRRRWWNLRPPQEYLETVERGDLPTGGGEGLDPADDYLEEVFLRMRTFHGIPSSWVEADRLGPFLASGLLEEREGSVVPTERGMLLLNELVLAITGERSAGA
ncbi:MAG: radical SAM family heme chaperone HemW [Actinomycetota bacterium]